MPLVKRDISSTKGGGRECVDHAHVKSPLQKLKLLSFGLCLLFTPMVSRASAQEGGVHGETPTSAFPAQKVEAVIEALQNPKNDIPDGTIQDLPVPDGLLTLENALRRALTQHPDLQKALADIESQEFGVTASTASRYPSFSFNGSAGQSGFTGQPGGVNVVRTGIQRSFGLGINLSQQLLDFGRTHFRVKISELQLAATRIAYLDIRQTVINNVVQSYFNLLREAQAIEVGLENVRNAQFLLDQARGFVEAGSRAKIEVVRAEADLANAKFGLVQAQGRYARALAALASALGDHELSRDLPQNFSLERPDWNVDTVRSLARHARPELIIAGLRVAQAEARVGAAKAEYYPSISANAGYNWSDSVFPPVNTGYNVGLTLSVPLINEPALSSAVGQAKAELEGSRAVLESTELLVVQNATEALYTFREAVGSNEAAAEGLRAAEENFYLASERYRVGVGNSLEVSEAQRLLVQARSQELQSRFDVQTAIGNLLKATGQLDTQALLPPDLRLDPIFDLPSAVFPDGAAQPGGPRSSETAPLPEAGIEPDKDGILDAP